jgi:hypothetical protein
MTGCVETTRCRDSHGYGMLRNNGRVRREHIVIWESENGPIPPGLCVCHKCDNPPCINLDHLFLGTPADNAHDRDDKGRNHHLLSIANVREIRAVYRPYVRGLVRKMANLYGVSEWTIYDVIQGRNWRRI